MHYICQNSYVHIDDNHVYTSLKVQSNLVSAPAWDPPIAIFATHYQYIVVYLLTIIL